MEEEQPLYVNEDAATPPPAQDGVDDEDTTDDEGDRYAEILPDDLPPQNSSPSNRGQVTYSSWMPPGPEAGTGVGEQAGRGTRATSKSCTRSRKSLRKSL